VPKWALTFVANTLYNEKYATHQMRHTWEESTESRITSYEWKVKNEWQRFKVESELKASEIETGSLTEFITEHYWGYAKVNERKTNEYEVTHPKWQQYRVLNHQIDVDFEKVYGAEFSILNTLEPQSVFLAEGSKITVEGKKVIK
jgi:uncharacterized protein